MKLSYIVQYLNYLDGLSVRYAAHVAVKEVAKITHAVQYKDIQIGDVAADLIVLQQDIDNTLKLYEEKLKLLRQDVQKLIQDHEPEYFADSTNNYKEGMQYDAPDTILANVPNYNADSLSVLENRLRLYADWRFPGLILRPAHNLWLKDMVALDPLYYVDTSTDLLAPTKSLFTPEYQRRLRSYVIQEHAPFFDNFPKGQFGFVCAFHYFQRKPLEIIKQYLEEIFVLLRPGGSFVFSFNNCDNWRAVGLVEHHVACYTPGRFLRQYINDIGYLITHEHRIQDETTWIEIKKPGTLDSLRGGQALAGIFKKSVDKPIQELYNAMQLDRLIEIAEILQVDISEAKTKREFNIKKVRRTLDAHFEDRSYPEETLRELFNPKENK
jgi:SAM-dependent methyltransferase